MTASTAYSRDLGDELRRLRETCTGMNGHALAVQLGWDPSKVSNIEHGKLRAAELDLVQYLTLCGKDVDYFEDFRERYRLAFEPYVVREPDDHRTIAMAESMAKKITAYDVMTVHWLLQTKGYARELLMETEAPTDIGERVRNRMDRQSVIKRPHPPELMFYVHELALQTTLGDAEVMAEQYLRLLANVHVVRVVPATVRSAALWTKCTLFEFEKAPPMAHTGSGLAQVFAQDDAAIERSERLFGRLDAVALDQEQSEAMLEDYLKLASHRD